ncbi:restriction endonuclease subunit R [Spirulina major]|uniref:restriction endonuclease subunit R n=1 Tax=Spirulina major TaxID=270636 RepID=UPI001C31D457|nr:restriction endonuclease subunit R [Spirulina major]
MAQHAFDMMDTLAIERHLKTLAQLQTEFGLQRAEAEDFFEEWLTGLPSLTAAEQTALDQIRERYHYQFSEGRLGEETIKLIVLSPLLQLAGFYNPPFQFRAEETIYLDVPTEKRRYRGRIDALVLQEQFWVIAIESKETNFSVDLAVPQVLAYLLANPHPKYCTYGMVTNGGSFVFTKLQSGTVPQYEMSDVFSLLPRQNRLYDVLQILKRIGQVVLDVPESGD